MPDMSLGLDQQKSEWHLDWTRVCTVHYDKFPRLRHTNGPSTSASIRVRWKQSIASAGVQTIGSFSLKLVLSNTGMPVRRSKAEIKS